MCSSDLKAILSKVEDFLDKGKLEDQLVQDDIDLQAQIQSIMHAGVSELDRAEAAPEEVEEVEEVVSEDTEEESEEDAYLKDIEKVLSTIQESMQNEMEKKKNHSPNHK